MALIGDLLAPYALIDSPLRRISFIIPDVVIEELHADGLAISDHPVESGGVVSDHVFKLPARLEMRCGWSNSTAGTEGYVQSIYQRLLGLQSQFEPFDVYTGKRIYRNMLADGIRTETSAATEYALMAAITLREITIVRTQQTSSNTADQSMPEKTGSITENGTVQPSDATQTTNTGSLFSSDFSGSTIGGLSPNAIAFGQGYGGYTGDGIIGNAAGGGSFGFGGPSGASPF